MIDRELELHTPDGVMNTFVTHPEEGGPHPVVLFYMDAPGKRDELHDMARRLGTAGYYVMLPNLYYRRTRDWAMQPTDESRKQMFEHMASLDRATIRTDTQALLTWADSDPAARGGKCGVMGYCMSGPFIFWAAHAHPERVAAAASVYGVRLCTDDPDSPHGLAAQIPAEVYIACAETDHWAPREVIDALDGHLRSSGMRYRIEWYPGTQHGFAFPQRQGVYHKVAAERHWERLHSLFQRTIQ